MSRSRLRLGLVVRGIVQGVGFRPFAHREACARDLTGWVRNGGDGVFIEVQGSAAAVDAFAERLFRAPPPAAVTSVERQVLPTQVEASFQIVESAEGAAMASVLPPDLATCAACWRDVAAAGGRRHRHPFASCAHCGPRYSIARALPYDRQNTTMAKFAWCDACAREYHDVSDRRHHAQPIACLACGPTLFWIGADDDAKGEAALLAASSCLRSGGIVALQGLGGFQLLVDARREASVARLRARKRRPHKPLAVMFRDLEQLAEHAWVEVAETLTGAPAPIVILRRRSESSLANAVAPGQLEIGAMVAPSPLHGLLLDEVGGPLVCTSGNPANEPMCLTLSEAEARLGTVADGFLGHDRAIARPLDDSVVRPWRGGLSMVRRARGYVPGVVARAPSSRTVLALGAHRKSTIALSARGDIVLSQHLGDLDAPAARGLFERTVDDLCRFFRAEVEVVACDLHPDYASTRLAETLAQRWQVPLLRVQHHHAHVATCLAEDALEGPLLGLAWDGTGFGLDGTIWGGEALRCEGARFSREAHLAPFPLAGGDLGARDPRRAALGALFAFAPDRMERYAARWFGHDLPLLVASLERGLAPRCSSMGRLLDAVAALIGLDTPQSFEGQAAMALETLASQSDDDGRYDFALDGARCDPGPLFAALLRDLERGLEPRHLARRAHGALVGLGLSLAERAQLPDVALSGGCFQNRLLLEGLDEALTGGGFRLHTPRRAPVNDGGIALGQAWLAGRAALDTLRADQRAAVV